MKATEFMAARKALGMTQGKMAERLGVGRRHIQRIEAGETPVRKAYAELVGHMLREPGASPATEENVK